MGADGNSQILQNIEKRLNIIMFYYPRSETRSPQTPAKSLKITFQINFVACLKTKLLIQPIVLLLIIFTYIKSKYDQRRYV
jgi:hypothetical protein